MRSPANTKTAAKTAAPSFKSQLARKLSEPTGAPVKPLSPKEFGDFINRSGRWVCALIRAGKIPTCEPHTKPYLIPGSALFKFTSGPDAAA